MRLKGSRLQEERGNAGLVCRRSEISRPTLRKLWTRDEETGIDSLQRRSRGRRNLQFLYCMINCLRKARKLAVLKRSFQKRRRKCVDQAINSVSYGCQRCGEQNLFVFCTHTLMLFSAAHRPKHVRRAFRGSGHHCSFQDGRMFVWNILSSDGSDVHRAARNDVLFPLDTVNHCLLIPEFRVPGMQPFPVEGCLGSFPLQRYLFMMAGFCTEVSRDQRFRPHGGSSDNPG